MYYLKRIISRIFFPVSLCLELMLAGVLLWRYSGRKRTGYACLGAAFCLLLILSLPPVADTLYRCGKGRYPAFTVDRITAGKPVAICVLGQSYSDTADIPRLQRLSRAFKERIWEAMRINRLLLERGECAEVWISIAGKVSSGEKAKLLPELAQLFQVDRGALHMIHAARDTEDEIILFRPHVLEKQVVLVSDQMHLPRAMMLAENHQLNAVAAPTHGASNRRAKRSSYLLPSAQSLARSEKAFYEFLGRTWVWLKGML